MTTLKKEIKLNQPTLIDNGVWKPLNAVNATILQASKDKILFNKVLSLIQQAQESICLQSFLIQDTAIIDTLIEATERGVRVFITSSAEARLKPTMEEDTDFRKDKYIKMLNEKFKYRFVHRSAANLHAKFIVIDGKTHPQGIIFTNNFTENGFFKNPELAVILNAEQATELYTVFVFYFWEKTTDEQTTDNEFKPIKAAQKFTLPLMEKVLLSIDKSLINKILESINGAKKEIVFSTFSMDKDFSICQAIAKKQVQNVAVSIFTRSNNNQLHKQLKVFLDNKSDIYLHPFTHAKFILIDNTEGYIFTANFKQTDFENDFNVGIQLSEYQVKELSDIASNWKTQFPYKFAR